MDVCVTILLSFFAFTLAISEDGEPIGMSISQRGRENCECYLYSDIYIPVRDLLR